MAEFQPPDDGLSDLGDPSRRVRKMYRNTVVNATATGAVGVDLAAADKFVLTLSGDVTLSFNNPTIHDEFLIVIKQGATPHAVNWPASVRSAPDFSDTGGAPMQANAVTRVKFYYDGTNYFMTTPAMVD